MSRSLPVLDALPIHHDMDAFRAGTTRCVRCSICTASCPSYAVFRTEADSPRGRVQLMRAAIEGRVPVNEEFEMHMARCLGCRACEDVCPSGVPYGALIDATREALRDTAPAQSVKRAVRLGLLLLTQPTWLRLAARMLGLLQLTRLDNVLATLARAVGLPRWAHRLAIAPRVRGAPFRVGGTHAAISGTGTETAFFSGCLMGATYGDVNRDAVAHLRACGRSVAVPEGQGCCGALHQHAGLHDEAQTLARRNIDAFAEGSADIVVNAAGCSLALKEYRALLRTDAAYAARAAAFSARVRDIVEVPGTPAAPPSEERVAVFEACHHYNVQRLRGRVGDVVQQATGAAPTLIPRGAGCCGSAGLYGALQPDASQALVNPLLDAVEASGCAVVVTANPGCHSVLEAGLRARGSAVRAEQLPTFLARRAHGA